MPAASAAGTVAVLVEGQELEVRLVFRLDLRRDGILSGGLPARYCLERAQHGHHGADPYPLAPAQARARRGMSAPAATGNWTGRD